MVFLVTDILRNETLCLNNRFIPTSPTLRNFPPQFWISLIFSVKMGLPISFFLSFFFVEDGTPAHPLKMLQNECLL